MALSNPYLAELAAEFGIATEFWDWKGRHTDISDETVIAVLAVAAYFPQSWLGLVMIAWIIAGFGMGLQNPSTSLAVMQLSDEAELGRNTSSLQVGESLGSSLFTGLAGAWFAHFHLTAEAPVTFGGLISMMVLVGLIAVFLATRIGPVENHSQAD